MKLIKYICRSFGAAYPSILSGNACQIKKAVGNCLPGVIYEIKRAVHCTRYKIYIYDGFLHRHDFCEIPPRVEYTLTELGESFLSVLDYMREWGKENLPV